MNNWDYITATLLPDGRPDPMGLLYCEGITAVVGKSGCEGCPYVAPCNKLNQQVNRDLTNHKLTNQN